jgi:hypothetical protein
MYYLSYTARTVGSCVQISFWAWMYVLVMSCVNRGLATESHQMSTNQIPKVGFRVLTAVVMKSSIFWDITPCSPLKVNRRFGGTCRLHLQDRRISRERNQKPCYLLFCSAYSSSLRMATCSSETSVDFQRATGRCIPEDITLQDSEI